MKELTATSPATEALLKVDPFKSLDKSWKNEIINQATIKYFNVGERICREDELSPYVYIIIKGEIRLLVESKENKGLITLDKRGSGQIVGHSFL